MSAPFLIAVPSRPTLEGELFDVSVRFVCRDKFGSSPRTRLGHTTAVIKSLSCRSRGYRRAVTRRTIFLGVRPTSSLALPPWKLLRGWWRLAGPEPSPHSRCVLLIMTYFPRFAREMCLIREPVTQVPGRQQRNVGAHDPQSVLARVRAKGTRRTERGALGVRGHSSRRRVGHIHQRHSRDVRDCDHRRCTRQAQSRGQLLSHSASNTPK